MTRTDAHAPVNMDPSQYEYLFAIDGDGPWALDLDRSFLAELLNFDEATADRGMSQCHHCGAHLRYGAFLKYVPTGKTIFVGQTCLDERFALQSKADFQRLRKAAQLNAAKQVYKTAAAKFVDQLEAIDAPTAHALQRTTDLVELDLVGWALDTTTDIRAKLWQYGSISSKQLDLVTKLLVEAPAKKVEAAARQAERDAEVRCDAPEGRQQIEGVVVARKQSESEWGTTWRITVKCATDAGVYVVNMTEPSSIDSEVGDVVRATVTLEAPDAADDRSFVFGKRPSKASIVESMAVAS